MHRGNFSLAPLEAIINHVRHVDKRLERLETEKNYTAGDYIREELEAREWTQGDLASVLGRPLQAVNEIVNGKKKITAETANELAAAFGTSADLWLNLEMTYQLSKAKPADPIIAQRAAQMMAAK